jgi:hypothetical protein
MRTEWIMSTLEKRVAYDYTGKQSELCLHSRTDWIISTQ